MKEITPSELHSRLGDESETQIIDVRTPVEFNEVHVASATNVPLDTIDARKFLADRNGRSERPLYIICRSGSRAQRACEMFAKTGFEEAYSVAGGTDAWVAAGLPVQRGRKAISLERQVRIAAGLLVLIGLGLGLGVNDYFLGISAIVGAGLVVAGATDWCGMGMLLTRMPWNRR